MKEKNQVEDISTFQNENRITTIRKVSKIYIKPQKLYVLGNSKDKTVSPKLWNLCNKM